MTRTTRLGWTAGILALAAACSTPGTFAPVTPQGRAVSDLFIVALAISTLVFLLVVGVLTYSIVRFRGRPGDPDPPQVEGNRRLEAAWTATPALVLLVMFALMVQTMGAVDAPEPAGLRVQVVGWQWWWEFRYPELGVVTANELHLPVGVPVQVDLQGGDVVHSFWVPALGPKRDAIPGKINGLRLRVDQPGVYDGDCTEYCGMQHAWMRNRVVAEPRDQFDAWVAGQQRPAATPTDGTAVRGQQVFLQHTCVNCHTVQGTAAAGTVGPNLTHLGSRGIIGAGVLENTRENLRSFVQHTQDVKPGVLMPSFSDLPPDDVQALATYLEGLK